MIELKAYSVVATSETENYINGEINLAFEAYDANEVDTYIATLRGANEEKTERIVELQKQVDELDGVKKSAELILMSLLDCGLIKEWYFNGKFNAILKADDPHLKIAELKQKLEDAKATAYTESVDAGMENRKLKRALWLSRAEKAKYRVEYWACRGGTLLEHYPFCVDGGSPFNRLSEMGCLYGDSNERLKEAKFKHLYASEWMLVWENVERKCLKKAEEYK